MRKATGALMGLLLGVSAHALAETPSLFAVTDYGAACDGSTDDSSAIQAAVNAAKATRGTVVLPPGRTCAILSTVILGDASGAKATSFISLVGAGPASSTILWRGSTSGVAIDMKQDKYFRVEGFAIRNGVAMGSTIGLREGGFGRIGTETLGGVFDHLNVSGFYSGIQAGDPNVDGSGSGADASDNEYRFLELDGNHYGWTNYGLNTLNHVFHDLNVGGNAVGLYLRYGNVYVDGGSTYGNTTADYVLNGDSATIKNIRAEVKSRFLQTTGDGVYSIEGIFTVDGGVKSGDNIVVELAQGVVSIRSCIFQAGKIATAVNATPQSITIEDSEVHPADALNPVVVETPTNFNGGQIGLRSSNNRNLDAPWPANGAPMPSVDGMLLRGYAAGPFVARLFPTSQVVGQTGGGFQPPEFRPFNMPMLAQASTVTGRTMRLEVQFQSSGILQVTFVRTLTASESGDAFAVSSGHVSVSDLGRRGTVTPSGGRATPETLITAVDPAANTLQYLQGTSMCGNCGGVGLTVGENEPDASYLLMLGCNAPENISWSAKSATGFTLTSNNSRSTAICDVLLVR